MPTKDMYNGRESEVIVKFNDSGYCYSQKHLDASFRELVSEHKPIKSTRGSVNREDADFIMKEFDITQAQAEKVLSENGGDLDKTLRALVAS